MTKKTIVIIASVVAITLIGCGKSDDDTVTISQEEFDELMEKAVQAESNKEAAQALKDLEDATGADIPIEELTGEEEVSKGSEINENNIHEFFPYPISDEIKNSTIGDGTVQIGEDIFKIDYSMTPEDVAKTLNNSKRRDYFEIELGHSFENPDGPGTGLIWPRGFCFDNFGETKYMIIYEIDSSPKLIHQSSIPVDFGDSKSQNRLIGVDKLCGSYYFEEEEDGVQYIPEILYAGGIFSNGCKLDGTHWTKGEICDALDEAGYMGLLSNKKDYSYDDIQSTKGVYNNPKDYAYGLEVYMHIPELDSYEFTYTDDKVEYFSIISGPRLQFHCKGDDESAEVYEVVYTPTLDERKVKFVGTEALDKIEQRLRELGQESIIKPEIRAKFEGARDSTVIE